MNSEEVAQLVQKDIGGDYDRSNPHGVDLRKCLVTPQKMRFFIDMDSEQQEEHWLVLEEIPGGGGYQIVYDEDSGLFGLATFDINTRRSYFLGLHGTFLETLAAM